LIYKRDGLVFTTITDSVWGEIKIARILPTTNEWGCFYSLENTEWGKLVPGISEQDMERALLGDSTPIMNKVRDPMGCLKLAPVEKVCHESTDCASYHQNYCTLTHKKKPECFTTGKEKAVEVLLKAWHEKYHVVRIK
tara:strand:- start:121 stop:534 length:414 start_codon:yes stop_codon:yes gene_type:complete